MIRIGILTSWLSHRSGGLYEAVSLLVRSLLADREYHVSVFGLADHCTTVERERWGPSTAIFPTRGPDIFGYAPGLAAALESANLDILHVHGLWMYYSIASMGWIRITGRPCVISPHGMLDPWALQNSGWKKRLALAAYEQSHLESAACLHALCDAEAQAMRNINLRNPVCVIPNGLDTPTFIAAGAPLWRDRIPPGARILLYLGRLHPKKGLINLLHAWRPFAVGPGGDWHLAIAGWDQGGYESELRRVANHLGMASRVHFLGPLFGTDKAAAYTAANAFVLPSVSEGLPMVVLEAWSHGLPVLMTRACNLPEGFSAGAALEIGTDSEGIRAGLDLFARLTDNQRRVMGENGRLLCQEQFSQTHSSRMMRSVYRWLLNLAPRPDCVQDGIEQTESASYGMLLDTRIPGSARD